MTKQQRAKIERNYGTSLPPAPPVRVAKVSALPSRAPRDAALMAAIARDRDGKALDELAGHYAPRLKAWLMHRGEDGPTAEDIIQDVLVTVWHKADLFDPAKASFSTWVYRLTRNRWIDNNRKQGRMQPTAPDIMASLFDDTVQSAETDFAEGQMQEAVNDALATLPKAQKEMLHLAFFEGLTHSEIAERTGIALGTVKSRIRAPLKQLRDRLKAHRGDL